MSSDSKTMSPALDSLQANPRVQAKPWWKSRVLAAACLTLFLVARLATKQDAKISSINKLFSPAFDSVNDEFDWLTITPSPDLRWYDCYSDLQCARLSVPLDYSEPQGEQAAVALIKVPAKTKLDSEDTKPILINPGGPGGSGVDVVRLLGKLLQEVVGTNFDIVGFDPRGVGRTTPVVSLFQSEAERTEWGVLDLPLINSSSNALSRAHARGTILGQLYQERLNNVIPYVSTATVSRDMLSIVRAYGQEKLHYWGFSYGSVLGLTYASMFPDNVERLVVDGVVDVQNYFDGLNQFSELCQDTDKTFEGLANACVDAGPQLCPLYESAANKTMARINNILENIKAYPIPIVNEQGWQVVEYDVVRMILLVALYNPYTTGAYTFKALADLEIGDPSTFALINAAVKPHFVCRCPLTPPRMVMGQGIETLAAIMCSDSGSTGASLKEMQDYYERMAADSSFADALSVPRFRCVDWKVPPAERFEAPIGGKTSHPILLIGNTADPVTSVTNAKTMSKLFPGSVTLTQNSLGHCSIAAPSVCTVSYIRNYFQNGALPPEHEVCPISVQDMQFYKTVEELARVFPVPRLGLPM